uniref:Actin n=1 Tax=Chromera velia CCMP2878 TaxID=1169474 RepID=A0A0G4I989_9ALVE|eukprot:Cvel_12096.t1-p1 / transcript=Cvel_12096.t1 / gene=Cvel_12096 / organism=Chromera_velia_CCMP2878 / gene_product=Actin, putative / transcript_product=Actin, putative / location=Cvel_scaffold779:12968-16874(+) / protein_length=392 / sequence_SO=supercontig / SO=protein_coding / is_pseudo=false
MSLSPVIIDNGNCFIKYGRCEDEAPQKFRTLIGKPKPKWRLSEEFAGEGQPAALFGEQALEHPKLRVTNPMEHSQIEDMADMTEIWQHVFRDRLETSPEDQALLMTEPPFNPRPVREKMGEALFETLGVPHLQLAVASLLALYGEGRTSGLVVDVGDGGVLALPVQQGYVMSHLMRRNEFGGAEVTDRLRTLLVEKQISLFKNRHYEIARRMKESHCFVSQDPEAEAEGRGRGSLSPPSSSLFPLGEVLSNGISEVEVGAEAWMAPEALFDPGGTEGRDDEGIPSLVAGVLKSLAIDTRGDLMKSVVLTGGGSLCPGIGPRLETELKERLPAGTAPGALRVLTSSKGADSWFAGAKSWLEMQQTSDVWVSQAEWHEHGASILEQKNLMSGQF